MQGKMIPGKRFTHKAYETAGEVDAYDDQGAVSDTNTTDSIVRYAASPRIGDLTDLVGGGFL
jgi:hypothetical protein